MAEPKIPEPKDDDPEDVSDKLSIASAMWARGDRADAVNWLRRAAEAASDADLDLRALELAKMASELTALVEPAPTATGAPPRPAPAAPAAPAKPPQTAAPAPAPAPAAPKPAPKQSVRPPSSRPPGGKLPPLPPLRPLGSTPAAAPQQPKAPSPRVPSMISSVSGTSSASGTIDRGEPEPPAPPPKPASETPTKQMPWDERDDEPTHQIAIPDAKIEEQPHQDLDATAVHDAVDPRLLQAMKQGAASDGAIRAAAVVEVSRGPEPQASEPPPTRVAAFPSSEDGRSTREPPYLPLAVGVRVRLVAESSGIRVVPDDGTVDGGTAAILVPANPDDDLRALFSRIR